MEKEEPLVIALTNGDNENAVKKIVLDPDNGIVVTQDKARKKRSATTVSTTAFTEKTTVETTTITPEDTSKGLKYYLYR